MANKNIKWNGPKVREQIRASVQDALSQIAIEGSSTIKQLLNQAGTGRTYKQKGGRRHQASAPGQPPAPNFGTLRNSIQVDSSMASKLRFRIGTNLGASEGSPYPLFLEFGTRNIAPRPYWRVLVGKLRKTMPSDMKQLVKKFLDKRFKR